MSEYELAHQYETVNLLRAGGVAKIELNRPDRMNAWNQQFAYDLRDAVRAAADDDGVRAVLLTGAGRGFSSGVDLKDAMDEAPAGDLDLRHTLQDRYHPLIMGVRELPKPVVAAVHGAAAGIGASLALACDLVVAAESAYFMFAFVNIGLVPDGGSSFLVPARVGFTRAAELAMLGERLPARQALEWGLVNRVWPDAEFADQADALVARLAQGPTRSYAGIKRELNGWLFDGMARQLELEASVQQEMGGSADFAEGVTAFIEKRKARFTGA
jgi:2-(1,2-epoxy-1,2-dihydrophenyl)acetyl-CoA isomerase